MIALLIAVPLVAAAQSPVPRYEVKRAATSVTIDGKPEEASWAVDKKTGAVVAEIQMPGPTTGFPVTYTKAGRQYLAVAVRVGDAVEIVALALPAATPPPGRGGR